MSPVSDDPVLASLKENEALAAFEGLISAGCDRGFLLSALFLIHSDFPGFDSVKKRTGLDRKALRAAVKRFRRVAGQIEAISREHFGLELLPPSSFSSLRNLPAMLEAYSSLLEKKPLAVLSRVRNPVLHYQKFCITKHVMESSRDRKAHDEEVAAIIDAVLPAWKRSLDKKEGKPKIYDAIAHKQWRFEHYKELHRFEQTSRPPAGK